MSIIEHILGYNTPQNKTNPPNNNNSNKNKGRQFAGMSPNTNTHRHNLNKIEHEDEELMSSSSPLRSNGIIRMEQQGEKEGKNNMA